MLGTALVGRLLPVVTAEIGRDDLPAELAYACNELPLELAWDWNELLN